MDGYARMVQTKISLGVPALDYAPAPNYYNNLIRLVTNIENALLNYFRHLIFFSY